MRHALVTGGAGFIGHHLTAKLLGRGMAVTVLDDLSTGRRENLCEGARFIQGDVRDPKAVDAALEGVDCVFHNAALVSVRASLNQFVEDADVNLMGTLTLLRAMMRRGTRKAILASSMAVYADDGHAEHIAESHATKPASPYGIAKLAAEHYWRMMCDAAGIGNTILRYFNTYGPRQTVTPYVGVITIFVNRLLSGEPPLIFGDGEQGRDFVHVDDVVSANLLALDGDADGRVFNVGTGRRTSVNQIARELTALLAPGVKPIHVPVHAGELRNAVADISAIRRELGFEPRRAEVEFAEVIEFWRGARSCGGES